MGFAPVSFCIVFKAKAYLFLKRQSKKEDWRCKEGGWSKGLGKWEDRQERTQLGDDEEKPGEGPRRSMRSPRMSANVMRMFMAG